MGMSAIFMNILNPNGRNKKEKKKNGKFTLQAQHTQTYNPSCIVTNSKGI